MNSGITRIAGLSLGLVAFALSGCGGSTSDVISTGAINQPVFSVNGVVSDGPIQSARVWLDLDEDGEFDANEPSSTSDAQGNYNINSFQNVPANVLIRAIGGVDTGTNLPFEGTLEARQAANADQITQMVTPLTTLKANGLDETEIRAMFPDIPPGDIDSLNPNDSEVLERAGVVLHSAINQMSRAVNGSENRTAIAKVYKEFAQNFKGRAQRFDQLPIQEILQREIRIDSEKASVISSMIRESSGEMLNLNLQEAVNKEKLRDLQAAALQQMDLPIEELINQVVTKDQFLERTRSIRTQITERVIEQVTNQQTTVGATEIEAIKKQVEDQIKDSFKTNEQVNFDPSKPGQDVQMEQFNRVKEQIEQAITEQVQNTVTTDFVNSQNFQDLAGNVDSNISSEIARQIENQVSSRLGFDPESFKSQFGNFFPTR